MFSTAIMGIARHILTLAGGYLVAKGTIDAAAMETLVGAGVSIVGVVWSVIDKKTR
jgi:hypothetical protein